ncbi:hypothetical protein BKA70DRAFT_1287019 [Coprinopsis sp. MPI-PUGE-AT-0042]|nr:hypothetical protein BKA70DRAFT_1287019 [Coprinopsis sp. MPI-PUGE-AT-0042]
MSTSAEDLVINSHSDVLPMEVICNVMVLALLDSLCSSSILLSTCRTVHKWLLPLHYHSISFSRSEQLVLFHRIHDVSNKRLSRRFRLVKSVFIGNIGRADVSDLGYHRTDWPCTIVLQLLRQWSKLERMTIRGLPQYEWTPLEHVVPSSLVHITLGPVHGPFLPSDLDQHPSIQSFTSIASFMRDEEIDDVLTHPSMRVFRRIVSASGLAAHQLAVSQRPDKSLPQHLERLEFVIAGHAGIVLETLEAVRKLVSHDDPRIHVLPFVQHGPLAPALWAIPLREFTEFREVFFYSSLL